MGQKTVPTGFRVGITENWRSRWYATKKEYGSLLVEDQKIRRFIKKHYHFAGIPKIEIERDRETIRVVLHTARPGVVIGRKGAKVEKLKEDLQLMTSRRVQLDIQEVPVPELEAQLLAESVGEQLQKRAAFRRVMKNAIRTSRDKGALGVRIQISGRLGGSEMARRQTFGEGKIPLQTLQADVSYGFHEAKTTCGHIGVKTWIYRGNFGETEGERYGSHAKKG